MIMFIHYRTRAFILKKENRSEADRAFTIFTEDFGGLEVFGRSIRKINSKLRGAMELFHLTEVEFVQGRRYKILTDAVLIEKFPNLRLDLGRLAAAYKIAEAFGKLITGQEKDEKLWDLLEKTFYGLNSVAQPLNGSAVQSLYEHFLWQFLCILGYSPEHVSKKDNVSFENYLNRVSLGQSD